MFTEMTLSQLQATRPDPIRARELGELGFLQWLATLPGDADYEACAVQAWMTAQEESPDHPAVAAFREMIRQTLARPTTPLTFTRPKPRRRGGAQARRRSLTE